MIKLILIFFVRYKVQIRICDETGSVSLCILDRNCAEIVNKSAAELKDSLAKVITIYIFFKILNFYILT